MNILFEKFKTKNGNIFNLHLYNHTFTTLYNNGGEPSEKFCTLDFALFDETEKELPYIAGESIIVPMHERNDKNFETAVNILRDKLGLLGLTSLGITDEAIPSKLRLYYYKSISNE